METTGASHTSDAFEQERDVKSISAHALVSIVSILGSFVLLLIILCKEDLRRNITNWMVISGTIGILIKGLIYDPLMIDYLLRLTINLGACTTLYFFYYFPLVPFTLVIVALDQVLLKLHGERYARKAVVISFIVASWVLSITIATIIITVSQVPSLYTTHTSAQICISSTTHMSRMTRLYEWLFLYIPPVIILFILACILLPCCCPRAHQSVEGEKGNLKSAALLVWITYLVYFVMTIPQDIVLLIFDFSHHYENSLIAAHTVVTKIYLAYPPVLMLLWMVLLPDVRAALGKMLCFCCKRGTTDEELKLVGQ